MSVLLLALLVTTTFSIFHSNIPLPLRTRSTIKTVSASSLRTITNLVGGAVEDGPSMSSEGAERFVSDLTEAQHEDDGFDVEIEDVGKVS